MNNQNHKLARDLFVQRMANPTLLDSATNLVQRTHTVNADKLSFVVATIIAKQSFSDANAFFEEQKRIIDSQRSGELGPPAPNSDMPTKDYVDGVKQKHTLNLKAEGSCS